jgi:hypothetical protein
MLLTLTLDMTRFSVIRNWAIGHRWPRFYDERHGVFSTAKTKAILHARPAVGRHARRGLGKAARHAQPGHSERTLRCDFPQVPFGGQFAVVIDDRGPRREVFVHPGRRRAKCRCNAVERRRAGEHEALCTRFGRDLGQGTRGIHIHRVEHGAGHGADMRRAQRCGVDHTADATRRSGDKHSHHTSIAPLDSAVAT